MPGALARVGRRWPGAAECLQWAGLVHLGAGRAAEAVPLFDEAVARGLGGWSSLRFDLGRALMASGDLPRAEAEFREACRLTGAAPWARDGLERCQVILAHVEAERGRVSEGVALLSEVARHRWPQWASRAGMGAAPGFLILGQAKAGTSSLFNHLCAHPQVVAPLLKETHFWSLHLRYGSDWYRALFPPLPPDAGLLTGEASVTYLVDADVPRRIADQLPGARLIVLLRDPVERAYSHFRMNERLGLERESLEDVVARELDLAPTCPLEPGEIPGGYLTASAALPHLKRWLAHVPPERLLILHNRDLAADLPGVMARVCRHLGIEPFVPADPQRHNEGRYPPMPEALERRLRSWFAEHERALADFLAGAPGARP